MPSVISCPQCRAKMKLKTAPTPGKKVRCPKCTKVFAPSAKKADSNWDEDPYSQEVLPTRRPQKKAARKRKPKKASKSSGLTIAIVVGGLLMLAVGVIGTYKLITSRSNETVASNGNSSVGLSGDQAPEAIPTMQSGPAISDNECQSFVEAMERAVSTNNRMEFQRLMNFEGVIEKSMTGIELSSKDRADFMRGLRTAIPKWTSQFMTQVTTGSYLHLRTVTGANGIRQVLFRLNSEDGINYHKYDLIRKNGNQIVCGDFYIFTTGEYYSQTMRRILLPIIAHETRSILERLTGTDNALVANLTELQEIQRLTQQNDNAGAMRIFKSLPQELQREKFALLIRMNTASNLNEPEYFAAMEDFRKYHPNDVCLDLISIDFFLLKKQYDKSLACIDRLDEAVGGDPVLGLLRAPVLMLQERYAEALQKLLPLVQDEVHAEEAYTQLLDIYVAQNNHEETARTLSALTDQFGYQWELEGVPEFSAFIASSAYQEWKTGGSSGNPFSRMNQQPSITQNSNPTPENRFQPPKVGTPKSSNLTGRKDSPEQVIREFRLDLLSGRTDNAKAKIAPIQGSKELEAALEDGKGNLRHPMYQRFTFLTINNSHIEGDVAVAVSPFAGRMRIPGMPSVTGVPGFSDRLNQIYLVRNEDDWKICPTLDKPPTEPRYAPDVQAIQRWIESRQ